MSCTVQVREEYTRENPSKIVRNNMSKLKENVCS